MASQNDSGFDSFMASPSFISAFTVVDVNADGTISPVQSGSQGIGVAQEDIPVTTAPTTPGYIPSQFPAAGGYYGKVKLWTAPGTWMIMSNGAGPITPGQMYQLISGGTVGVSAGGVTAVKAIQAGVSAAGVIVEFVSLL